LTIANPVPAESLLASLRWRYAVKKFDPARKIAPGDWKALEEALVLTPSSYGLQPWRFVVVTDPALREQLVPLSFHQRQVADASHLVVLCIKKHLRAEDIDAHVRRTAEVRNVPVEALARYRAVMVGDLVDGARSRVVDLWAANQVFIALGNFMTSAAMLGIDTCPMEGFDPARYDQLLGLAKKGLASTVLCAAGYRAADDRGATAPKVRFPVDLVVERI
jgi:nitroreductase